MQLSGAGGNGAKTARIILIQTSVTKILTTLGVPCFMLKKLNSEFPWCTSVVLTFCRSIFMFLKYPLFLTVLGAGYQKSRLQTDLTLTEHLFGQSWPAKG